MADTKKIKEQRPLTKDEKKLAVLKAQKAKEQAFKLVVKIISWESASLDSTAVKSNNKISHKEWLEYKRQRVGIITPDNKDRIKEKLDLTYNSIKANGGFE